MKIQRFDGGLSTRLSPQLIGINEGVVYTNIDSSKGVLTPEKDSVDTDIQVQPYFAYFKKEDLWVSNSADSEYLEFQSYMYRSLGVGRATRQRGPITEFVGITAPDVALGLTNVNKADPIDSLKVTNSVAAGNLPPTDLHYLLFNVINDVRSTPFKFTVKGSVDATTEAEGEITPDIDVLGSIDTTGYSGNRQLVFEPVTIGSADSVELYRNYDGDWRQVSISLATVSFTDDDYDISTNPILTDYSVFNGVYQYVMTFYNEDDGSESAPSPVSEELEVRSGNISVDVNQSTPEAHVTHKRIYRVGNNITQFTLVEQVDVAVATYEDTLKDSDLDGRLLTSDNYTQPPSGLRYLSESYAMLFGALDNVLRFTPIGEPTAWPPEFSIPFEDTITGIGSATNGLLVMTPYKTHLVVGTGPFSLSSQPLRGEQGCVAFSSIQQIREGMLIWASDDGFCTSSGNNVQNISKSKLGSISLSPNSSAVLKEQYFCHDESGITWVVDYRFGNIVFKQLNLNIEKIAVAEGTLYGLRNGRLVTLMTSETNLELSYSSPTFVEGSYTELKNYKKVYTRTSGNVKIRFYVDEEEALVIDLQGDTTTQSNIPNRCQKGYSFRYEVEGSGTVHEVEWLAGGRKND